MAQETDEMGRKAISAKPEAGERDVSPQELARCVHETGIGAIQGVYLNAADGTSVSLFVLADGTTGMFVPCDRGTYEPPKPDRKWILRPIRREDADELIRVTVATIDTLALVVDEKDGDRRTCTWNDTSISVAIGGLDGQDESLRCHVPWGNESLANLFATLLAAFDAIPLPSLRHDDELGRIMSLAYGSFSYLSPTKNTLTLSRGSDGCPPAMTFDGRQFPLSDADWKSVLSAIREADFPSWGTSYNDGRIVDGGGQWLMLFLDDGWTMSVQGDNLWDTRFSHVLDAIKACGFDIPSDRIVSGAGEESIQVVAKATTEATAGSHTCLHFPTIGNGYQLWQAYAGFVRIRAILQGTLIEDIELGKGRDEGAYAVVRPVRTFPREGEGHLGIESATIECVTSGSCLSAEYRRKATGDTDGVAESERQVLSALSRIEPLAWNDPSEIIRWGCQAPSLHRHPAAWRLGLIDAWHAEVIWEDGSVTFAEAVGAIPSHVLDACDRLASVTRELCTKQPW